MVRFRFVSRLRAIASRGALSFGGIVVTLLALELASQIYYRIAHERWFWQPCESGRACPMYRADEVTTWRVKPRFAASVVVDGENFRIRTNSFGFRDGDHSFAKPNGTFRILVLGDSFTFGWGVEADRIYARLLQGRLLADCSNKALEIITAGTPAWGIEQELAWLKQEGLKFEPDLLILEFYPFDWEIRNSTNKVVIAGYLLNRSASAAEAELRRELILRRHLIVYRWIRESEPLVKVKTVMKKLVGDRVWKMLKRAVGRDRPTPGDTSGPRGLDVYLKGDYPEEIEGAKEAAFRALDDLWAVAKARGAKAALIMVPPVFQIHQDQVERYIRKYGLSGELDIDKPTRLLRAKCNREGWDCLDLAAGFMEVARAKGERLYFPWDPHWTSLGHEVAAQLVGQWIRANGLVPACK